MKFIELITQTISDFRAGILGGFLYGLHAYFYQKSSIIKSIVAFLIGAICGSYFAHPINYLFPVFSIEVAAFASGLFSMKVFEALISIEWTELITDLLIAIIDKFLKIKK